MVLENLILLSVLQGTTEFLPVSSSAHLAIANFFSQNINQSVSIDLSLHVGSLLAMIIYFYRNGMRVSQQSHSENINFELSKVIEDLGEMTKGNMKMIESYLNPNSSDKQDESPRRGRRRRKRN